MEEKEDLICITISMYRKMILQILINFGIALLILLHEESKIFLSVNADKNKLLLNQIKLWNKLQLATWFILLLMKYSDVMVARDIFVY